MIIVSKFDWRRYLPAFGLISLAALALSGCGGGGNSTGPTAAAPEAAAFNVPKATCGPNDHPETGLQGQVSAALRASGFKGFNCNLQLVGQYTGEGASWQHAWFQDGAGHSCAYYDTSFSTTNRTHLGVVVLDVSDPTNPTPTNYLSTIAMLDPWESLRVNVPRQLLGGTDAHSGTGGPEIELYSISADCRNPQLITSTAVGTTANGDAAALPAGYTIRGHEGTFAPDGLTYYGGDRGTPVKFTAIDISNTSHPQLLAVWPVPAPATSHGLSLTDDGNRAYMAIDADPGTPANFAALEPNNGVLIMDTSQIQSRMPNPQFRAISQIVWKDGSHFQHTIPITVGTKHYLIGVDEGGSGGLNGMAGWQEACNIGLTPFNMARIIDINDETNPFIVSKLQLEVHNPANCSQTLPDLAGQSSFTYGSHYCSVDNRENATTLACGYFNSGIRVFDIRDPANPKEIAYFNPPGRTTASPGSNHGANFVAGGPDWCNAQVHLNAATASLQTTCQDNGFLSLKFENGVWPFPTTTTPPGENND